MRPSEAKPSRTTSDKALSVAIAGALAAPMAAQAVDFTISGQVSRTFFSNDSDAGTSSEIRDNNGTTRVRANGSSELDGGGTIGIQFEYAMDAAATLRHANIQYRNGFGAITVGQGSEAGDGSAGYGPGVTGIGAGQDGTSTPMEGEGDMAAPMYLGKSGTPIKAGGFFSSLDGGGRNNMIRYDTPSLGPVSAAVSVGNGDSVSALLNLSTEVAGSTFQAKVGTYQLPGNESAMSASFGVAMASGLAVGGAWGKGKDVSGAMMGGMDAVPAVPAMPALRFIVDPSDNFNTVEGGATLNLDAALGAIQPEQPEDNPNNVAQSDALALKNLVVRYTGTTTETGRALTDEQKEAVLAALEMGVDQCYGADAPGHHQNAADCNTVITLASATEGEAAVPAVPATAALTDPSYVRLGIGYTFGDTTVAASWYNSENMVVEGSEGTALGFGVSHALPKVGTTIHASVQTYDVESMDGTTIADEAVFQIGALVTF